MQLYETIYIVKQDPDNKSLKDLKKNDNLLKLTTITNIKKIGFKKSCLQNTKL